MPAGASSHRGSSEHIRLPLFLGQDRAQRGRGPVPKPTRPAVQGHTHRPALTSSVVSGMQMRYSFTSMVLPPIRGPAPSCNGALPVETPGPHQPTGPQGFFPESGILRRERKSQPEVGSGDVRVEQWLSLATCLIRKSQRLPAPCLTQMQS